MRRYRWNAVARRYIDEQGNFVARSTVQSALESALVQQRAAATAVAEQLARNEISIAAWEVAMRDIIKTTQLWSAALSEGGWAQLTQSDFGRIGQIVRVQYGWLEQFARQLSTGLPFDGQFYNRVRMYLNAARATHQAFRRASAEESGMTQERNVEGMAEHCLGCAHATSLNWVAIGTLVPIGSRDCRGGCQCDYEFQ